MRFYRAAILLALAISSPVSAQQAIKSEELLTAVREGDGNKLQQLAEGAKSDLVNTRGFDGSTPLSAAVETRNALFAQFLLSKDADPDLATRDGRPPLLIAARLNWLEGANLLLSFDANVEATNRAGETALIVAVQQRNNQLVRRLLEAGANPDKADHAAGYSARDYAKRDNRVRELLRLIETVKPKVAARP